MTLIIDGVEYDIEEKAKNETIEHQKHYDSEENRGVTSVSETTELGDSLKELNRDSLEKDTRMSSIDMRSRLHYSEIASILAVDSLVAFKFLPTICLSFTRSKKRLCVSDGGKGRTEIVDIVAGKREHDISKAGGFTDKVKSWFGGSPTQTQK